MNIFIDLTSEEILQIVILFAITILTLYCFIKLSFLILKNELNELKQNNRMKNLNKKYEHIPIIFEDGSPFVEERINVLIGFQIINKLTGRILPHTDRHVIYGKHAARKKLKEVTEFYSLMNQTFPIDEYYFEPIYVFNSVFEVFCDEPINGYLIEYDEKDIEEENQY